jgi:hypothetical protein
LIFHNRASNLVDDLTTELLQRDYTTCAMPSAKDVSAGLKNGHFDPQKFLRILPEVPDQQPQVSSQSGQIIVELWVREELPGGGGVIV